MKIAVNTRFLLAGQLEGFGYYTHEVFGLLAALHPDHEFHFIFDRQPHSMFLTSPNIRSHVLPPAARHPLLWKLWYDLRLPILLKRIGADVFISPDAQCSLSTRVPQCVVVHDLGFLHFPEGYKKSHLRYYKRFTPKFLSKAARVITVSSFTKSDIVRQYNTAENKLVVAPNAARQVFKPLSFEEQEKIKMKYTGGAEFFICVGAIHPRKNLVRLLKAFSLFKKRLQSGMKLVLAGRLAWKNEQFLELLKTYKHRNDVILTGYLPDEELARLQASAYALVYPSLFEGFGVPVLEAMACRVPVITSKNSAMQEVAGSAAIYFDPHDIQDIADKMMRMYKDETLRNQLINNAAETSPKYSWQHTANIIWQVVAELATVKRGR